MKKLIIFLILAIHAFAEKCTETKLLQLVKGLKMKCVKGQWVPVQKRGGLSGLPCEDDASVSAQGTCSADHGHCSQFTEKGAQMDRDCPGTCDSCDGCRCQDNSQWHPYCPVWAQYCNSPGVLGNWMGQNCRKSCNKCKCKCCSYQGKMHGLNEHIPLPDKCGELVCEEGLVAEASPLLTGAAKHNVSHPEELTLVFRSLFPGAECCLLPVDEQDRNNREKMVQEGWSGQLSRNGDTLQATCCHGILCVPLKDGIEIKPEHSPASTTAAMMTTATETPSCPSGWSLYESSCYLYSSASLGWTQAQEECKKENSNLASVTDLGIQTFIGYLISTNNAWIGGSRPAGSNPNVGWEWIDNSPWKYQNWYPGEPSHETELCLLMFGSANDNKWNDATCSWGGYGGSVCEKHWTAA